MNSDNNREILWIDPDLTEESFKEFASDPIMSKQNFYYDVDPKIAYEKIKKKKDINFVLLTSGTKFPKAVRAYHSLKNVSLIILYTHYPEETEKLTFELEKTRIVKKEDSIGSFYRVLRVLFKELKQEIPSLKDLKFVMDKYDATEFKLYKKKFDEAGEGYIKDLVADITALSPKDGDKVIKCFEEFENKDAVKGFCRVYTLNEFYSIINYNCCSKRYDSIIKPISIVLRELASTKDLYYTREDFLFRGILTEYEILKNTYKKGFRGYWPSFSSTSTDSLVAIHSFSRKESIVFRIN